MKIGFYDRRSGILNGIADPSYSLPDGAEFAVVGGDVAFDVTSIAKPAGMRANLVDTDEEVIEGRVTLVEQWELNEDSALMSAVDAQILADLRSLREPLLTGSDWTQLSDSPLSAEDKAAWAAYRQELRDLPDTIDLSELADYTEIEWPSKPE